jgi:GNAT superfamily N-acetyltransferase
MRAREFIIEYNGLRFTTDIKNGQLIVRALDDWGTNELGHVVFNIGDQDELDPQDLEVDERYQGQGIASTMYDYVKTLGYEIHRSWDQTPAGAGFWNKHRGEDQRVWESVDAEQVLDYVKRTHAPEQFDIEYSITDHPKWELKNIPLSQLKLDPDGEERDPYNRVNWVEYDTVNELVPKIESVLKSKPIVVDSQGWIIDGNHRATAAAEAGLKSVPAYVPIKQDVTEAFNQPYTTKSEKSEYGDVDMLAKLPDGTNLSIMFNNQGDDEWQVEFYRNNSQEVTGEGDAQRVFATVLTSMQKFIKKYKPWRLTFSANKDVQPGQNSESRAKLYNRLVQRYSQAWGYEEYSEDHGDQITYELTRLKQGVAENFADGKHPEDKGDSKRYGVPTKASVSALRKVAKQGGRKGQLAHWMANMKSGRAKAKRGK